MELIKTRLFTKLATKVVVGGAGVGYAIAKEVEDQQQLKKKDLTRLRVKVDPVTIPYGPYKPYSVIVML